MKKLYWRRRNALIPTAAFAAGFAVIFIGLIVLVLRLVSPGLLTSISTPLWRLGSSSTEQFHTIFSSFGNVAQITRERDMLVAENQALKESNRGLQAQVADVTHLVGARTESAHHILAGVLAHPPVSPYDTLIIDRGGSEGVRAGSTVYGPGMTPIGSIESAGEHTARVALFSAPGRITDGWVGEKRVALSITGVGSGAFTATLPRESGVVVGDVVYLPGPGALPVGSIVRIDSNPSSPRDTVHIAPYTNLFSLTWVEVAP